MGWSLGGVLNCVVSTPDKAVKRFDPEDLSELRETLRKALLDRDLQEGRRAALLWSLVDGSETEEAPAVVWGLTSTPLLPPERLARALDALAPPVRKLVLAELGPPTLEAITPHGSELLQLELVRLRGRRGAIHLYALTKWVRGRPERVHDVLDLLRDLVADGGANRSEAWAVFQLLPRPVDPDWIPLLYRRLVDVGWAEFDAAFGDGHREALINSVIEGLAPVPWTEEFDEHLAWIRRHAPHAERRMLEALAARGSEDAAEAVAALGGPGFPALDGPLGPARVDDGWVSALLEGLAPGGQVDLPALERAFGPCEPRPDLMAESLVHDQHGAVELVGIRAEPTTWGFAPAGEDFCALPHDPADLAAALHTARQIAAAANDAALFCPSDGDDPWEPFVGWTPEDSSLVDGLSTLLGFSPDLLRTASLGPNRALFKFGEGEPGEEEALQALYDTRTRHANVVDLPEGDAVAPRLIVGRRGPYTVGVWCMRTWT
jgi:hypothetical protein